MIRYVDGNVSATTLCATTQMTRQSKPRPESTGHRRHGERGAGSVPTRQVEQSDLAVRIADGVVEACCLVAVAMLPLYFPFQTAVDPETNKAIILIALMPMAAAAWLLGELARHFTRERNWHLNALLVSGVAVLVTYAIATVFSIHPTVSFFGTYQRHQGFLTHAAYAVFFICVATRLRRTEQFNRLVGALILASLPVVIFGLLQQLGIDPAPTTGDPATVQWPVRSSFGNHVFLGAYLVLVMPLTAARLFNAWEHRDDVSSAGRGHGSVLAIVIVVIAAGAYEAFLYAAVHNPAAFALMPALIVLYTLLAIGAESVQASPRMRKAAMVGYGALLVLQLSALLATSARGALFGVIVGVLVAGLLVAWYLRRPTVLWGIMASAAVLAVFVLVLNISAGPLQPLRRISALNRVVNIANYANESSGAGRLLIWQGLFTLETHHPGIGTTWGGLGRNIVGYGPEAQDDAFEAIFPLKLRVATIENYTWDRAHDIYLDILVDAGILGLLAFSATLILFFQRSLRAVRRRGAGTAWLLIGTVSGVAGHLVEGIFAVETAASLLLFWVLLGLGASPLTDDSGPQTERLPELPWGTPLLLYGVFLAVVIEAVVLFGTPSDHPDYMTTLWLLGMIAGVGVVTWVVMRRAVAVVAVKSGKSRNAPAATVRRTPGPVKYGAAGLVFATILVMVIPWNFHAAALEESTGFAHLTSGQVPQGLGYLQQAASTDGIDPKYREDLATVYMELASASPVTGEPGYTPSGDAPRTIDPQRVQTLGRDQLFQLAILSLRAARSLTPLDPHAYAELGDAYAKWKRWNSALSQYRQAESLSHDNPLYIDGEAIAYLGAGDTTKALSSANAALQLDTAFWLTHFALARTYHTLGQRSTARLEAAAAISDARTAIYQPTANIQELKELQRTG